MLNDAKRILIIGCSGSGKSTLTRLIAEKFALPVIHLDMHFWNPGWIQTPTDVWREKVKKLVEAEKWVMDGTHSRNHLISGFPWRIKSSY